MREPHIEKNKAPGAPGIEPRWTGSAKDAVGTAYSTSSCVWFTISLGILNEIYYPTVDRPQVRDFQFLITDGETFVHDERGRMQTTVEALSDHALGYRVTNVEPEGRYQLVKEIIADPHQACVLVHTRLEELKKLKHKLRLYALLEPHMEVGGKRNNGEVIKVAGRKLLVAHKNNTWLAMGATVPYVRCSAGYVGESDGWTDLKDDGVMDWEYDWAPEGNIALTGELDISRHEEFTLGIAFGDTLHRAVTTLFQSLGIHFEQHRERYIAQWERACRRDMDLAVVSGDDGSLFHHSESLLLAHEDKTFGGALIASLSIPWGDAKGDEDLGGYHLVWVRDMVNSATGLMAAGNKSTALRALIYLATTQLPSGGFYQNFWINGKPYWHGVQLDETAFPILLAWRLHQMEALENFDPYHMVLRAAGFLIREGPATQQERWEENSGYSPSTLAAVIAALTCAASFALAREEVVTADFIQAYADFLECHVEAWTVTDAGSLLAGVPRHYIRVNPVSPQDTHPDEDPDRGTLRIANRGPDEQAEFPARDIIDAGFLELVRYGIRKPGDALIEDSLKVVDAVLKVDTQYGPCWRRYNHDGYGQRADGGPYMGWGQGRPWPLLTGERGHYELAAGRDVKPYIQAMEGFAHVTGLLPEQIWDIEDLPAKFLRFGCPTGAAMPLMWAHAEYVKLLRSCRDKQVFDFLPQVAKRYLHRHDYQPHEVWKFNRQVSHVAAGLKLRVLGVGPFTLNWSADEWQNTQRTRSTASGLGIEFVDIPVTKDQHGVLRFTFFWLEGERWEGQNYEVEIAK